MGRYGTDHTLGVEAELGLPWAKRHLDAAFLSLPAASDLTPTLFLCGRRISTFLCSIGADVPGAAPSRRPTKLVLSRGESRPRPTELPPRSLERYLEWYGRTEGRSRALENRRENLDDGGEFGFVVAQKPRRPSKSAGALFRARRTDGALRFVERRQLSSQGSAQ